MHYKCMGCDNTIPWDGTGSFSYTCQCRATVFWDEETGSVTMPGSVVIGMSKGRSLPHLDDLVGNSDFTSPRKEAFINELKVKGFIWMEECEQCKKDGTLKRKQAREKYWLMQEAEHLTSKDV